MDIQNIALSSWHQKVRARACVYACMYVRTCIYIHMRIVEVGSDIWLRVLVIHGLNLLSPDPGTKATTYIKLSIHNVLMHIASHGQFIIKNSQLNVWPFNLWNLVVGVPPPPKKKTRSSKSIFLYFHCKSLKESHKQFPQAYAHVLLHTEKEQMSSQFILNMETIGISETSTKQPNYTRTRYHRTETWSRFFIVLFQRSIRSKWKYNI